MDDDRILAQPARIRLADAGDAHAVTGLMADFYAEDGMPFRRDAAGRAVARLIGEPGLGRVWVAESGGRLVGYAALTLGFSLEYMGVDGFVDDLYVAPSCRRHGLGGRLLATLADACFGLEVRALHLEVGRSKTAARELYRRFGFEDHDRLLMTRMMPGAEGEVPAR